MEIGSLPNEVLKKNLEEKADSRNLKFKTRRKLGLLVGKKLTGYKENKKSSVAKFIRKVQEARSHAYPKK